MFNVVLTQGDQVICLHAASARDAYTLAGSLRAVIGLHAVDLVACDE